MRLTGQSSLHILLPDTFFGPESWGVLGSPPPTQDANSYQTILSSAGLCWGHRRLNFPTLCLLGPLSNTLSLTKLLLLKQL